MGWSSFSAIHWWCMKAWLSPDSLAQIHGGNQNSTAYSVSWKLIPFAVEQTSEQNRVNKAKWLVNSVNLLNFYSTINTDHHFSNIYCMTHMSGPIPAQ